MIMLKNDNWREEEEEEMISIGTAEGKVGVWKIFRQWEV